ncbi:hypothetical protein NPIL_104611 [Nephila pilipes]|uniref:Uncharacterized protein n=1 Tax=Nephila pilipes TaxID=299642 RepID=A0A8X6TWI3_NEPPI|nr:hypothetical protein NPIL_104611 [Nephila pilipes]
MSKVRSKLSKKRQFYGNRFTPVATNEKNDRTSELYNIESANAQKVKISHKQMEQGFESVTSKTPASNGTGSEFIIHAIHSLATHHACSSASMLGLALGA